jgi:hypothetical protein
LIVADVAEVGLTPQLLTSVSGTSVSGVATTDIVVELLPDTKAKGKVMACAETTLAAGVIATVNLLIKVPSMYFIKSPLALLPLSTI